MGVEALVKKAVEEGGPIRPHGLLAAINRAAHKKAEEIARAQPPSDPIVVPSPIPVRTALQEVASMLLDSYDKHRQQFPGATIAKFLDKSAGDAVRKAWVSGKPIAREDIVRALANLYEYAQRQQGESKPIVVSSGNRAQRRAMKRQTKREVIKV